MRVSWFGNADFECVIENVTLSYFAATANQELAPDVKSAHGIRESVDTTDTDTPRCQPQVCCTNGGRKEKNDKQCEIQSAQAAQPTSHLEVQ